MTVLLIGLLQPLPGGVVLVPGGTVLAIDVTAVLVSAVGLDPLLHPVLPPVHLTSSSIPSKHINIVLVLFCPSPCPTVGLDPLLHPVLPPVHLTSSPLPSINIIVLVLHHSNICHVG